MRTLLSIVLSLNLLIAQDKKESADSPCGDPLIRLAELEGIKAVPLKDMVRLKKLMKACERAGGKDQISKLYKNDWNRDYKKARRMASWTSTHAMCVFVSFGYYFVGKALATSPDSD